jgi:hypothetical protein
MEFGDLFVTWMFGERFGEVDLHIGSKALHIHDSPPPSALGPYPKESRETWGERQST